jgi:carboxypeptidase T
VYRVARVRLAASLLVVLGAAASGTAATFQSTGLYQSFDEMVAWSAALAAANPDLVDVFEFGRSEQDRPLLAVQLSTMPGTNDPAKPEFLFVGGEHAREVVGSEAIRTLADTLVAGYRAGDPFFVDVLAEREVWLVPNLNPDGRIRVEAGYSIQRKNMQLYEGQGANDYTRGVDLNRNFPHRWSEASSDVRSETYAGPSDLSTPEASALWTLLHDADRFSDLWAAIDFHSGAETILTPWTSPNEFLADPLPPEDRATLDLLAARMSQETGFSTARLTYDSYGTLVDSLYEEFGTYAFVEEIYRGPFNGYDYFTYFNPTGQLDLADTLDRAVRSGTFLLSDEAFPVVPEPATLLLLAAAVPVGWWLARRRARPGR